MKSLGSVASVGYTDLPAFCGVSSNLPMLDSYVVSVVSVRFTFFCFSFVGLMY